jgi:DNA repair protein RadC
MVDESAAGHRERLRERFARGGIDALLDYEILELLLTFVQARGDTKPVAKRLLAEFKSLSGVLNADPQQLQAVDGVGPRTALLMAFLRDVAAYCLRERVERRSAISHRRSVEEYLRFEFGHRSDEFVAVLFLDTANAVMSAQVVAEGTVNQCVIYPREIVRKALQLGAASMILAHNHPAGTVQPSEADWSMTARLHEVGRLLDLPLLDHLIVCRNQVQGLRELPRWPR